MKKLILIHFLLVSTFSFGQTSFEEGYFIDNSFDTISCFIKNIDWLNNPEKIKYKLSKNGNELAASISNIREFGISNNSKFVRIEVKMDQSSEDIDKLGSSRNPEFTEEVLFLKVIIDGQVPLYSYTEKNLQRYFFKIPQSGVEQLVFKSFIHNGVVRQNNLYKQQLLINLNCESISSGYNASITYSKNDLSKYFQKYYECKNLDYTLYKVPKKRLFHLEIRPGLNFSSLVLDNPNHYSAAVSFSNSIGFRIGTEIELVMPFNNFKWAVTFEPTYKNIKSETQQNGQSLLVNFHSLEIPVGLRHYFFLNADSKIFVNAVFAAVIPINSKLKWENGAELIISKSSYLGIGIGFDYKNKISFESRYSLSYHILGSYPLLSSDYSDLSLIVGYSLF